MHTYRVRYKQIEERTALITAESEQDIWDDQYEENWDKIDWWNDDTTTDVQSIEIDEDCECEECCPPPEMCSACDHAEDDCQCCGDCDCYPCECEEEEDCDCADCLLYNEENPVAVVEEYKPVRIEDF